MRRSRTILLCFCKIHELSTVHIAHKDSTYCAAPPPPHLQRSQSLVTIPCSHLYCLQEPDKGCSMSVKASFIHLSEQSFFPTYRYNTAPHSPSTFLHTRCQKRTSSTIFLPHIYISIFDQNHPIRYFQNGLAQQQQPEYRVQFLQ